jgi:carbon storage regulator CsrA
MHGSDINPLNGVNAMLVLGRKENQRLIIDGKIIVTVVRASNGAVRLGIEAPSNVSVQREEIFGRPAMAHRRQLVASAESC